MYLLLVYYTYKFVIVYAKRYINIIVLILISPITFVISTLKKIITGVNDNAIKKWLKEFIFNVVIQTLHAIFYAILIGFTLKLSDNENPKVFYPSSFLIPNSSFLIKKIAVARDEAFSFYYPESLRILSELGAQIIFFSPLRDKFLPEADAYIFGGGFPEIFARELSENFSMLESLKKIDKRKKILAECGGLMYLCESLENLDHEKFKMAGLLPFDSFMTKRPVIGYMEARALKENLICEKNSFIRGHEFHYSRVEPEFNFYKDNCAFELTRRRTNEKFFGGYTSCKNILASYLHINFFGNINLAKKFLFSF